MQQSKWRCVKNACFARQCDYWILSPAPERGAKPTILFLPLPIQVELMEAVFHQEHPNILFSGSVGSSKSYGLRWLAHWLCLKKQGFKVLLLRRTYRELEDSHILPLMLEAEQLNADYRKSEVACVYAQTGSRLRLGHCASKGDEFLYQGDAYDLILFDEESLFHEDMITYISSRLRTDRHGRFGDEWEPVALGGTNVEGPGRDYLLSHYIEKNPDADKYPRYNPERWRNISSLLFDNPYLNDSYLTRLDSLPKGRREALINGDWYAAVDDAFFEEFLKEPVTLANGHVLQAHTADLSFSPDVDRFMSIDHGYSDLCVVHWIVITTDGNLYVEDEFTCRLKTIPEVCKEIKRRNKERRITPRYVVAGPDLDPLKAASGISDKEVYRRNGVKLRLAKGARVVQWRRFREFLRHDAKGIPHLRINPKRCPELVRTLPLLKPDEDNPEDIAESKHDHAAESLRYACSTRHSPTLVPADPPPAPGSEGALIAELQRLIDEERYAA